MTLTVHFVEPSGAHIGPIYLLYQNLVVISCYPPGGNPETAGIAQTVADDAYGTVQQNAKTSVDSTGTFPLPGDYINTGFGFGSGNIRARKRSCSWTYSHVSVDAERRRLISLFVAC